MQQSLLRVLQEKKITRLGESTIRELDIRVIAATNKNLLKMCKENNFRFDLYYRLSVVDLTLPSLREFGIREKEEIFDFILKEKKKEFNKPEPKFSAQIKKKLLDYPFPGNIRELENLIERLYATVEGEVTEKSLPTFFNELALEHSLKLKDIESNHIQKIFEMSNKNVRQASRVLGISYNTLKSKIQSIYK